MRILIDDNVALSKDDEDEDFDLHFKKFKSFGIYNEKLCRKGIEIGYCDYCKCIGVITESVLSGGRKDVNKCSKCSALEITFLFKRARNR